jgi:predicted transcriptional regulator
VVDSLFKYYIGSCPLSEAYSVYTNVSNISQDSGQCPDNSSYITVCVLRHGILTVKISMRGSELIMFLTVDFVFP